MYHNICTFLFHTFCTFLIITLYSGRLFGNSTAHPSCQSAPNKIAHQYLDEELWNPDKLWFLQAVVRIRSEKGSAWYKGKAQSLLLTWNGRVFRRRFCELIVQDVWDFVHKKHLTSWKAAERMSENRRRAIPDILECLWVSVRFSRCRWNGDLDKSRELVFHVISLLKKG